MQLYELATLYKLLQIVAIFQEFNLQKLKSVDILGCSTVGWLLLDQPVCVFLSS